MRSKIGDIGLLSDDSRSQLTASENGRSYRVTNSTKRRLLLYRVDGGVITSGLRCDYALGMPGDSESVVASEQVSIVNLIELKGTDLKHAAAQILSTLTELGSKLDGFTINGRIVLSRVSRPDIRASNVIALERKLATLGGELRKSSRTMDETV